MDPPEAVRSKTHIEIRQRRASPVFGVERLREDTVSADSQMADVRDAEEQRAGRPVDGDLVRSRAERSGARSPVHDPVKRTAQSEFGDRLQEVVGRLQLERLQRVLIEGRHEHDGQIRSALADQRQRLEPRQPGHPNIEEDDVVLAPTYRRDRLARSLGKVRGSDPGDPTEQMLQLGPRRRLVVHDENAKARPHHGRAPAQAVVPRPISAALAVVLARVRDATRPRLG